jgi:RNA polymerase sigma-70 factor (ECF subfamily)
VTDSQHDDEALLREFARTRADAAFERLLNRHWPRAYRLAHDCLHDPAAAEDVAQEVFVKLSRATSADLELKGAFAPWFRTLVLNGVRDRVKVAERRRRHEERAASLRPTVLRERPTAALEAEDLRREVARLPLDVRVAVVLRYFEGRTHEDVARLLDCPPGTASSRIRRGLEQLREQLAATGASVASVSALEALLAGVTAVDAPAAPSVATLLPRGRAIGLKLALASALLLAAVTGTVAVVSAGSDDASVAALGGPAPAPADALAPDADATPTAPAPAPARDRAAASGGEGAEAGGAAPPPGPATTAASPAAAPSSTERPSAPSPAGTPTGPGALVLAGRVLGAPAMTPLADAELFVLRRETIGGRGYWSAGGAPLGRSDAAGEFRLSSACVSNHLAGPGDAPPALTDVLLFARRPGFRPFLRRLPASALDGRLDLVLEQGAAPRVSGRVVDADGAPLAGLRVHVTFELAGDAAGLLLGEVAPPAQAMTRTGTVEVALSTGDDGRFVADGLLPVDATVWLPDGQSHVAAPRTVRPAPGAPELLLVATASARLEVDVLDRAGAPCPEAFLALLRPDGAPARAPVPVEAGGRAVLVVAPGPYRVAVGLPGAWTAEERATDLPDHQEPVELRAGERRRLVVRPAGANALGTITALVKDAAGAPVTDHEVWLTTGEATSWRHVLRRRTDALGRAEFPELPRGGYKLQAQSAASAPAGAVVTLEGAQAEVALVAVQRRALRGVVRGPDGAPVAGATVGVTPPGGGSVTTVKTDGEGRFAFEEVPVDGRVSVTAPGFLDLDRAHRDDGRPLELTLAVGRVLTVRGRVGPDVPDGTRVAITFEHTRGRKGTFVEVHDGQFEGRFVGLARGASGTVSVRVGQAAAVARPVRASDDLLDLGQLGAPDASFAVRARVEDPTGILASGDFFAHVSATVAADADRPGVDGTLDRAGRLELRGLPGEPMVLFVHLSSSVMGDERSATAEVRFDPRTQPDLGTITLTAVEVPVSQMNALRVTVTDASGVLARAGFRDGDLIVGVGGELFEHERHAISLLMRLEQGPIDVDVQRGAERIAVRLGPDAMDPERAGGRVDPCLR